MTVAPIIIRIGTRDVPAGPLQGFDFFWCKYVASADFTQHCTKSLVGAFVQGFWSTMQVPATYVLMETGRYPFVYLCGVDNKDRRSGVHVAMQPAEGDVIELTTWTGMPILIHNARQLTIPPLPRGWNGLGYQFTTCKNYQFAVAYVKGRV